MISREVIEGPQEQGTNEQIAYTVTTTPWGGSASPASLVFTLYDTSTSPWTDVTSSKSTGSASAAGNMITTPVVKSLTDGVTYRAFVRFTCSGNVFECWFDLVAKR